MPLVFMLLANRNLTEFNISGHAIGDSLAIALGEILTLCKLKTSSQSLSSEFHSSNIVLGWKFDHSFGIQKVRNVP